MPAPADPAGLLGCPTARTGGCPTRRSSHLPAREITDRFDGWFGSLMTNRRDWTPAQRPGAAPPACGPSPFAQLGRATSSRRPTAPRVLESAPAGGADLLGPTTAPRVKAIGSTTPTRASTRSGGKESTCPTASAAGSSNLLDERDVLTVGAWLARQSGPARSSPRRQLLEAVPPRSRDALWRFAAMALSDGGRVSSRASAGRRRRAASEGRTGSPPAVVLSTRPPGRATYGGGGRSRRTARVRGGRPGQSRGQSGRRWRMMVE